MFKIVQYNIYFGFFDKVSINGRINNICKCLNSLDVDVICLQEVLSTHTQIL